MGGQQSKRVDRAFFFLTLALTLVGFVIFYSASLGLLNRGGAQFNSVAIKQFGIMVVGLIGLFSVSQIDYRHWQKWSWLAFVIGLVLTALVFIPGLGFTAGGAQRWIVLGGMSFQTSEFLKLGYVLYLANWLSRHRDSAKSWKQGITPFLVLTAIVSVVMVAQPDISTLAIMLAGGVGMLFVAGIEWRQLAILALIGLVALTGVILTKPYTRERIKTFFNPDQNVLGSSYQVNQSLIAIGSGGITGRGFGQSIQKFKYLPEPIGDSIFSVAAEEFGFIGSTILVALFLALGLSGLRLSARINNSFGRLTIVGIVIMILAGVFINITSMVGLMPLNGTPLLFISQGGTALLLVLIEAGIVLNISKHLTQSR